MFLNSANAVLPLSLAAEPLVVSATQPGAAGARAASIENIPPHTNTHLEVYIIELHVVYIDFTFTVSRSSFQPWDFIFVSYPKLVLCFMFRREKNRMFPTRTLYPV